MPKISDNVKEEMIRIISLLEKWNYEYHILNQPTAEDQTYDCYFKQLEELEKKYNFVFPNSPTQKVGHSISKKFLPVYRQIPMLSLDSVDNYEDLIKFDERVKKILKINEEVEYVCE